jgi:hypothetical protein
VIASSVECGLENGDVDFRQLWRAISARTDQDSAHYNHPPEISERHTTNALRTSAMNNRTNLLPFDDRALPIDMMKHATQPEPQRRNPVIEALKHI